MKKLYLAKQTIEIMFISDFKKDIDLRNEAEDFIKEEMKNLVSNRVSVKEITQATDVPKDWREAIVWGQDDEEDEDLNPIEYLKKMARNKDPDYKEYLRLKKKFDGIEEE